MDKLKKVNFSVSNLYIIMNMNYFKNFDKVLFNTWRTFDKDDYEAYSKKIDKANSSLKGKEKVIRKNQSNFKQLDDYQKKYSINLKDKVRVSQNTNDNTKINTINKSIIDNLPKSIPKQDLENIKRLVNNSTNTVYGIRNESSAIQEFKRLKKCDASEKQKKFEYNVLEDNGISFNLIGKIDALTDNNEIVEIKNRMKCLFNELRGYEKPQIMTYMYMNKSERGYLVENLKKKEENNINIISIDYEKDYFEKNILTALVKYYNFFKVFITKDEWKLDLLKGEEDKLYQEFKNFC